MKKELILLFLMFSVIGCRKQWINTNIDGTILNEKPSVKDDFYQAVNYEKLKYYSPEKDNEFDILVKYISSMVKQNKSTDENEQLKHRWIDFLFYLIPCFIIVINSYLINSGLIKYTQILFVCYSFLFLLYLFKCFFWIREQRMNYKRRRE